MSNIRKIMLSTYRILREDENLLRLLYYPPENLVANTPEPLSSELPNILDMSIDKYWDIVDRHILTTDKADDLEKSTICRIYIYSGRKRPTRNMLTAKQEIVIDVLCHMDYEQDMRLDWIGDYLSKSYFLKRLQGGLGRVDYRTGYDFVAPRGYQAYRHIYEVGGSK